MNTPKIYAKAPVKVTLEKGKLYSFCTCGHSATSPFCDGVHKTLETELRSLKFEAEKDGEAWLCQCKQTKNPPYCDGSHKEL